MTFKSLTNLQVFLHICYATLFAHLIMLCYEASISLTGMNICKLDNLVLVIYSKYLHSIPLKVLRKFDITFNYHNSFTECTWMWK